MIRKPVLAIRITQFCSAALIVCTISPPFISAQSLGDVARLEAARRKAATTGKVYTNGDLPAVEPSVPMPPPPAQQADAGTQTAASETPSGQVPAAEAAEAAGVGKDEAQCARIPGARDRRPARRRRCRGRTADRYRRSKARCRAAR
jgi:hypothetical protein